MCLWLRVRRSPDKKQSFFISFKVEATSSAPQADKLGTSQATSVLTGQCFGGLAQRCPSSLPLFQPGSHMSWVKQKKILNCLLFLSAGTRKGSGERQMSLSPRTERQTVYKALLPLPLPVSVYRHSFPQGYCLEILCDRV